MPGYLGQQKQVAHSCARGCQNFCRRSVATLIGPHSRSPLQWPPTIGRQERKARQDAHLRVEPGISGQGEGGAQLHAIPLVRLHSHSPAAHAQTSPQCIHTLSRSPSEALSGWCFSARVRYAFFTSSRDAVREIPSTL